MQKVQLTSGDELEVLICPEGVVPVLQFLKDHHNAQFASLIDIAGMDVPSRKYRFEVSRKLYFLCRNFAGLIQCFTDYLQHPVVAIQFTNSC